MTKTSISKKSVLFIGSLIVGISTILGVCNNALAGSVKATSTHSAQTTTTTQTQPKKFWIEM
ncbi:hypothetical protein H6G93_36820 [Nostoc sp. FACHB-973]|nr:hypothetical protein [Nostoc sp. FACHB-973]